MSKAFLKEFRELGRIVRACRRRIRIWDKRLDLSLADPADGGACSSHHRLILLRLLPLQNPAQTTKLPTRRYLLTEQPDRKLGPLCLLRRTHRRAPRDLGLGHSTPASGPGGGLGRRIPCKRAPGASGYTRQATSHPAEAW